MSSAKAAYNNDQQGFQKTGSFGGGYINPKKAAKEMLTQDYGLLKNNPSQLGLNKSEIGSQMRDAQSRAAAQVNASAAQMAQSALAGQGFQSGAMQQSARDMAQTAAQAGAAAGAGAHDASRKMIERETARIRGEVENQWVKKRDQERYVFEQAMKTLPMIAQMASGVATGGMTLGANGGITGGLTNMANGAAPAVAPATTG